MARKGAEEGILRGKARRKNGEKNAKKQEGIMLGRIIPAGKTHKNAKRRGEGKK